MTAPVRSLAWFRSQPRNWLRTGFLATPRGVRQASLLVIGWCLLGSQLSSLLAVERTATKSKKSAEADLREVLQQSSAGAEIDREEALEAARAKEPQRSDLQWQSGHTFWNNQWVPFSQPSEDAQLREKIAEYEKYRESVPDTLVDQMRLADWCRDHGLPIQERAHLLAVLKHNPNHVLARNRAGWRLIGSRWVSEDEIKAMQRQTEATARAAQRSLPALRRAFAGLDSQYAAESQRAERLLSELQDPDLVPIYMEQFANVSHNSKLKLLRVIEGSGGPMASMFLAQVALQDPTSSIGVEAMKALRSRPLHDYVPMLLSMMATPVETRFIVEQVGRNDVRYIQVFANELEDYKQVGREVEVVSGNSYSGQMQALQRLYAQALERTNRVGDLNLRIQHLNRKAALVLNAVTRQDLPPNPDSWWKWWNQINESFPQGEKYVYSTASYSATSITPELSPSRSYRPRCECLVAGTPIWTITGPRAVETIKTGDLVLAQDPDSGELSYKAVMMPTRRPPGPIVRIELPNEVIRASSGHLFWVAGLGWTRASSLTAGKRIHDVSGSTLIKSVEAESEPVETFNLIVDGFHSYFVGESKILSHDNSIPRGTDAKVPGFRDR